MIATGVMLFYLFATLRSAAEVEDCEERLTMFDEAIEYMDHVLIELIPTVSSNDSTSFQFPGQTLRLPRRLE
jgi:hypothetical protein